VCGPVASLLPALVLTSGETAHKAVATGANFLFIRSSNRRRARAVSSFRVGATFFLVSVSRAGGFDEARGFAMFLAGIRIFDELK
jgi:hypothetical protein